MTTRVIAKSPRRRWRIAPFQIAVYAILLLGALLMLFPSAWMIASAFKSNAEITAYPPHFLPRKPTLQPLKDAWTKLEISRAFINSVFVTGVTTPLSVLTSAWVGFVLSKYEFWGKKFIFSAMLATVMIPGTTMLIPNYQMVRSLGLLNTYTALILPAAYTTFGIFMMRQFMHSVPDEFLDAARIDGASEPRIFLQVVLPMVGPSVATLAILQFRNSWDALLWPLVVLSDQKKFTLAVRLATLASGYDPNWSPRVAASFIATAPVLIIYVFFQRYIVRGAMLSGISGF
jgi:ABC-type glycerol-3-phosphate transport system permease component